MTTDGTVVHRWDDLRATPWANGGGITREIAASPPEAALDSFDWRVSIADVDLAGPFSTFPGVDRVITLLEGPSMVLDLHGERQVLAPQVPFAFAGEAAVHCTLPDGPTRDLNVMTRRGVARADVQVIHAWTPAVLPDPQGEQLLIALSAGVRVATATGEHELACYETVHTPGPATISGGVFAHILIV